MLETRDDVYRAIHLLNGSLDSLVSHLNPPDEWTPEQVLKGVQASIVNLGLIDGLELPSGSDDNTSIDIDNLAELLEAVIRGEFNLFTSAIMSIINTQNSHFTDLVHDSQLNIVNSIAELNNDIYDVNELVIDSISEAILSAQVNIVKANNDARNNIINFINGVDINLSNQIQNINNSIDTKLNNQLINTANILDSTNQNIGNRIEQSTNVLLSEIRQLGVTPTNTGGSSQNYNSAWTNAYIEELLTLLDTLDKTVKSKELSVEVINNVNGSGGNGGNDDDWDSSAGIGDLIDPFGVSQALLDGLLGFLSGSGDNDETLNSALDILMASGSGQFTNIEDLENAFKNAGLGGEVFNTLRNVLGGLFMFMGMGSAIARPYLNNMETLARTDALDGLLPTSTLLELQIRNLIPPDKFLKGLTELGFNGDEIALLLQAVTNQLPEPYIRQLYLRDEIDFNEWKQLMLRVGYRDEDIPNIFKLIENVPPTQDGILFAVREAYDDNLAEQLNLDYNYDSIKEEFEPILKANGISPQYAKYYWRSHWRLPSPTQLYQMFWRGLINEDELLKALEVSDYSPQWTEKLKDIAYSEYTRVDIRRMHKMGLLTDEEVKQAYKRIGYDDTKAENLKQFTIGLNGANEDDNVKSFTLSQSLKLYSVGLLSKDDTELYLKDNGYSDYEIDNLLGLTSIVNNAETLGDITKDNKRRIISSLSKSYIEGILPRDYVADKLRNSGQLISCCAK